MKKIFILFFILTLTFSTKAQWLWDYGFQLGVSNYLGDIGGKEKTRRDFVADMKLSKTRWNAGAFARYKWRPKLSAKLAFDYLRIEGDDKLSSNPARNARNLNFRNDMFDLALTGEYFFYEDNDLGNTYRYRNGFRAYIFAGVGGFYSNPKAYKDGQWVKLRPLHTEGVKYKALGVNIPMGLGFYFTIHKKHRIGYEMNYRMTFTDYIDDISGNYPDDPSVSGDPTLTRRIDELGGTSAFQNKGVYYSHNWGNKRGDKSHKDGYMTMNISYSYVIRGKSSFYRGRYGHFFGKRSGRKMRKIRAKF